MMDRLMKGGRGKGRGQRKNNSEIFIPIEKNNYCMMSLNDWVYVPERH